MSEEQTTQKVQITIKLDADVLDFFKKRASQANTAPYQTQINQELRLIMESGGKAKVKSKKVKIDTKKLLTDKKFIKALTEEIKKNLGNSN
jgi:BrnA antitoxin of type II toxin-antitoxin system